MKETKLTQESGDNSTVMTKVKMRFPNESYFEDVIINMNDFKPENEFQDEVFGWYKNTYVSISK